MFLEQFMQYEEITIQCHDSPDADTLGAGYGLFSFFEERGKCVRLVYSGANRITKPGLVLMVEHLEIPIRYVENMDIKGVLITVDCQYRGGNVTPLQSGQIGMVDHHPACVPVDGRCCIRSGYGSCCTVVWELLQEMEYDVNAHPNVATALYYGLYSDTGQLSEIYHPVDRKMRDSLYVDREILDQMLNANLSRNELLIAGEALAGYYYDEEYRFATVRTRPCDPNLLGVISDLVNQVATIDMCVVYNETLVGYKMSVRSCMRSGSASRLVTIISEGIGAGGGHINKAGGTVMKKMFQERYPGREFEMVLRERIRRYVREDV